MEFLFTQQFAICIAIGALTGVVAALCGVGGGIIMVPAFVAWLGLSQKQAVVTSLAAIILISLVTTAKNTGGDLVQWKVVVPTALAGALVGWFAADALKSFSNENLTRIFAVLMILVGTKMLIWK